VTARAFRHLLVAALLCVTALPVLADRETAVFFTDRGEKALKAGDGADAEAQFQRALEEDATYAPARFGLARAFLATEKRADGVSELKRSIEELRGVAEWKSTLGKAESLLDEVDRSGAELRALVDAHVEELVSFARKWLKKDEDIAVRALRAALALRPGHAKAAEMIESLGLSAKGPPRELFDGETLTGWIEMGPPRWEAKDGVITGNVEDAAYIGRTLESFEGDFDVRMEARLAEEHEGAPYFALCPAFDGKDGHYSLGLLRGKVLFQEDVAPETDREVYHANPPHDFEPTEWHVYELRFRGSTVTAFLDGTQLAVDDKRPDTRKGGFIGLKCQDCRVEIRSVQVTPR